MEINTVSKLIEQLVQISALPNALKSALYASAQVVEEKFFTTQSDFRAALSGANLADAQQLDAALQAVWWRCLPLALWFKDRLQLTV